jgi:hypothetical protein
VAATTGQAGTAAGTYLSPMPALPAAPAQLAPSAAALNGLTSAVMTPTTGEPQFILLGRTTMAKKHSKCFYVLIFVVF